MPRNLALTVAPITDDEFIIPTTVVHTIRGATDTILARGAYTNPEGVDISIDALQIQARAQQRMYSATHEIAPVIGRYTQTQVYVYNQTALTVARERVRQGYRVAMLHFVSSPYQRRTEIVRPTQSDSLMCASSLAYCLQDTTWADATPFYDDSVVVTPQMPIFRDHGGDLLMEPWQCSVVHAVAINVHEVRQQQPEHAAEIPQLMVQRAQRIIRAAATTRANVLVLGAWGCGRAGHDAAVMAAIWQVALMHVKAQTFGIVDFAVADVKPSRPTFAQFYQRLHQQKIALT